MNLDQFSGKNMPGLKSLEWVYAENVIAISYPNASHQVDVTLKAGNGWNELYLVPGSAHLVIENKNDLFKSDILAHIPKTRPELITIIQTIDNKNLILKATDHNDMEWLIGTIDEPARLSGDKKTIKWDSRNQAELRFDSLQQQHPFTINNSIEASGDFNNDFNEDFDIA